jgi:hypothetical protein
VVLESRAHFVSKYEVVFTSGSPVRISDDRIQLFRKGAQFADMSSVVVSLLTSLSKTFIFQHRVIFTYFPLFDLI